MNKKNKLDVVFGYKTKGNSDKIQLGTFVTTNTGKDTIKNPINFTAKHFNEILSVNDSENSVLRVSEAGLAEVSFNKDGIKSQYYMVKVGTED